MKDPAVSLHMNLEIILYLGAGVLCAFLGFVKKSV